LLFEQVALGGMAYAVVAETFGVSEVHARKIVHDLKSKLKTILQHLIRGSGEQTPFQNP
jgi:DNA-directed RNA polymerase specialized sigma24 family protein